ncbi:MAG: Bug family tripartite tricarboxylate transporter substrate binding protein [Burkholderiales bacterium]
MKHFRVAIVLAAAMCAFGQDPQAQTYPVKPIRLVVPYAPGGPNDTIGRIFAQRLSEAIGQQVIVDNRAGGGGNIGTDYVARAAPDGYTLLSAGMGSTIINPLIGKVSYDAERDFTPIMLIATAPNVLAVHPSTGVATVAELIALAKQHPGKLNAASSGLGSSTHLSAALFEALAGIRITHIPYKGSAPSMTALLSGEVELSFLGIPNVLPHWRSGKLLLLAVATKRRSTQIPDVPTIAEAGLPDYEVNAWYGIAAPTGTPAAIVNRLHAEMMKFVGTPAYREALAAQGAEPVSSTPEEFAMVLRADKANWSRILKDLGIRAE